MSTADCTQENCDIGNPVTVQTAPAQGLGLNTALSVQKIYLVLLIQTSAVIIQQRESEPVGSCVCFSFSVQYLNTYSHVQHKGRDKQINIQKSFHAACYRYRTNAGLIVQAQLKAAAKL